MRQSHPPARSGRPISATDKRRLLLLFLARSSLGKYLRSEDKRKGTVITTGAVAASDCIGAPVTAQPKIGRSVKQTPLFF